MNTTLYNAYLLHHRPYSDSQIMIDMLVEGVGQLRMLARLKGRHSIKHKAQLQPFQQLLISYSGKGDLKYLTQFELSGKVTLLKGKSLYCGFYLNELCQRIIPHNEPIEDAYHLYHQHINYLQQDNEVEPYLRTFEFQLLELLGYGVDFEFDIAGDKIQSKSQYQFFDEMGWGKILPNEADYYSYQQAVYGEHLLAILNYDFKKSAVRQLAKQLSRYLLKPLLGNKPLKSRELFIKP